MRRASVAPLGTEAGRQPRKRGKKRAIVAVARKLAVILHSMWRSGRRFQPFPQTAMAVA